MRLGNKALGRTLANKTRIFEYSNRDIERNGYTLKFCQISQVRAENPTPKSRETLTRVNLIFLRIKVAYWFK